MQGKPDYDKLSRDILSVLKTHRLQPINFGIVLSLSKSDFEDLAVKHEKDVELFQDQMILVNKGGNNLWFVQITKQMDANESPSN